jgi:hypothetical protein
LKTCSYSSPGFLRQAVVAIRHTLAWLSGQQLSFLLGGHDSVQAAGRTFTVTT